MAIYEIINVGANKALNIYGSDVKGNTLYDGRSIILWTMLLQKLVMGIKLNWKAKICT